VRSAGILDSLGWRLDPPSKLRRRNGRDLRFSILVPTTSLNRINISVLLQEQLRKVGVAADLEQVDGKAFGNLINSRDFDAALLSWHLGTSPASIREIWTTEAAGRDGINYGSYKNPVFDAYVDSAVTTVDTARSRRFYNLAYQTAIDDAPAVWLYEPNLVLGLHKRIHTEPYRPDAWWYSVGEWDIPAAVRIPRDRVGGEERRMR
jgi:peptide/nickel transport system substrate-binding protein